MHSVGSLRKRESQTVGSLRSGNLFVGSITPPPESGLRRYERYGPFERLEHMTEHVEGSRELPPFIGPYERYGQYVIQAAKSNMNLSGSVESAAAKAADSSATLGTRRQLPNEPPELYSPEKGDPVEFYWRVWGAYAHAGMLYQFELRRRDLLLYQKLHEYCKRRGKKISEELKMPNIRSYTEQNAGRKDMSGRRAKKALWQRAYRARRAAETNSA